MKKLILILTFAAIAFTAFATETEHEYITTDKGCFHFKKIRFGIGNTIIGIKTNGDRQKFQCVDVLQFKKGGYIYERVKVVKNNQLTDNYDFMKIVCRRDEMTLYEYGKTSICDNKHIHYYVYRKERFVVELCSHKEADLMAKLISAK